MFTIRLRKKNNIAHTDDEDKNRLKLKIELSLLTCLYNEKYIDNCESAVWA